MKREIALEEAIELYGDMRRGITVLKMRGSSHVIDDSGAHIGAPFRNVAGILAGNPVQVASLSSIASTSSSRTNGRQ